MRSLLRAYRENQSRAVYLEAEAEEIKRGIAEEQQPCLHAQSYDFNPRVPSSPTEMRALREGETESSKRWQTELTQIEQEAKQARLEIARVDVWLMGLTAKGRTVITAHEIDHMSWPEVSAISPSLLGYHMTGDGLRGINRKALEKLARITR